MKLNMDCVREILITVEDNTGLHKTCHFIDEYMMNKTCASLDEDPEAIPEYQAALQDRYSNNKLIYHVNYCIEAGLLKGMGEVRGYKIIITDLSVSGHDFLGNIRSHDNWEKVKTIAANVGSFSIGVLQQIAGNVVSDKLGAFLLQ